VDAPYSDQHNTEDKLPLLRTIMCYNVVVIDESRLLFFPPFFFKNERPQRINPEAWAIVSGEMKSEKKKKRIMLY
jgi:hypothetical protein